MSEELDFDIDDGRVEDRGRYNVSPADPLSDDYKFSFSIH